MKKTISFLLALVMVLSLAACGTKDTGNEIPKNTETTTSNSAKQNDTDLDAVEKAVLGLWLLNDDGLMKGYIFRDDGTVYYKSQLGSTGITQEFNGTYIVMDDGIELTNEYGKTKMLTFSYQSGTLKLFDEGKELDYDEG